jgi:hypothetical protein
MADKRVSTTTQSDREETLMYADSPRASALPRTKTAKAGSGQRSVRAHRKATRLYVRAYEVMRDVRVIGDVFLRDYGPKRWISVSDDCEHCDFHSSRLDAINALVSWDGQ